MEKYKVSFSRSRHCYSLENIFNVKHVKKVTCMRKDRDVVLERCAIWCVCVCVCVCVGAGGGGGVADTREAGAVVVFARVFSIYHLHVVYQTTAIKDHITLRVKGNTDNSHLSA